MAAEQSLPILNLERFAPDHPERDAALAELRNIAHTLGFFYLSGHGIPQERIDGVLALSRKFFALSDEDKVEIQMKNSPHFRGYNGPGLEYTRGQKDWREQVDFGASRDRLTVNAGDPPWKRLVGPNQYPSALPELKPAIEQWIADVTSVGIRVLKAYAEALGQSPDVFAPIYAGGPNQLLKIIRYPGRDKTETDQGVGAHKDSGFVTLLLQDTGAGLQVDDGHGGWIEAKPVRGTFVINTGEILEMASNGFLRANIHRVVTPKAGTDRMSVAFFLGANLSATVPVLTLPEDLQKQVRGVTQDPLNPLFSEVGRNFLKSRLRSHPDVAQAHHADLITEQQKVAETA